MTTVPHPAEYLRSAYRDLYGRMSRGEVTLERFQADVAALQVQGVDGAWWRLDPATAQVVRWDGTRWAPASAASGAVTAPVTVPVTAPGSPPTAAAGGEGPRTLAQLVRMMVAGMLRQARKALAVRLTMALAVAFGVWLLHTLLLIGPNGGFASDSWFLSHILALGGWKFFGGTVFWGLSVYIVLLLWSKRTSPGIGPFVTGLFTAPATVVGGMSRSGSMGLPLFLLGATVAFLLGSFLDSLFVGFQAAFMVVLSLATGRGSLVLLTVRLGYSDLQRWSGGAVLRGPFQEAYGPAVMGGLMAGFLATAATSNLPTTLVAVAAVALAGGTSVLLRGATPPAMTSWVVAAGALALGAARVLADDGGWSEAGGSFAEWMTSEGAMTAVAVGTGPAAASLLAFLLGSTMAGADFGTLLDGGGWEPGGGAPPGPPGSRTRPSAPTEPPPTEVAPSAPGPGPADRESGWMEVDGKVVPVLFNAAAGTWVPAAHGAVDKDGNVLDGTAAGGGAWMDQGSSQALEEQRSANQAMVEAEREKTEEKRLEAERKELERLEKEKKRKEEEKQKKKAAEDAEIRAALREQQAELERQRAEAGGLMETAYAFAKGSVGDLVAAPGQILQMTGTAGKAVFQAATDGDNWRALGTATVDTLTQFATDTTGTVKTGLQRIEKQVGSMAHGLGTLYEEKGGVELAKTMLGVDNWEKALDPNVPPGERILRAMGGVAEIALSASGSAAFKAGDVALDVARIGKVADKLEDATKLGRIADKTQDAARVAKELADLEKAAIKAKRAEAGAKISKLQDAIASGDQKRIMDAAYDVQKDKQAIYQLNKKKASFQNEIGTVNKEVQELNRFVDEGVLHDLSRKYPGAEIRPVDTTNPSSGLAKLSADRDITYQMKTVGPDGKVYWKDIPAGEVRSSYNQKLWEAGGGKGTGMTPDDFAGKQGFDHAVTDGGVAEAYGKKGRTALTDEAVGNRDLDTVLKGADKSGVDRDAVLTRDFADAQGVGQTISHKGHEWFGDAGSLRQQATAAARQGDMTKAKDLLGQASTSDMEGMRQLSKQYNNITKPRFEAARKQLGDHIPPDRLDHLEKAVRVMDLGHKSGVDGATIRQVLKKTLNTTPEKVAEQMGGMVESLQTLKPGP